GARNYKLMMWFTAGDAMETGDKVTYERKVDPLPILIVKIVLGIFGFIMNVCVLLTLRLRLKYQIYIIMMTLAILSWTVVDCILCYQTGIINSLISFVITAVMASVAILLGFKSKHFTPRGYAVFFGMLAVFCIVGCIFCIISEYYHFPYNVLGAIFLGCG
ncbi:unnamed protein product, partial [Trichobilharzia szidati]